jgi:alpha-glucosidase
MSAPWWSTCVGYEIYVSSFQDSNGDGIGDLPGITSRLGHLHDLGVDLIWITPFFPSPLKDQGYDVSNYCDVDPRFGTLADLDVLVEHAHALGIRVIFDLVLNHTSDQHPWFVDSRSSRTSTKRDWYIWRDGKDGDAGLVPPNNWVAHFGGGAWTFDDTTKQWYLHLFLPEQPDLDWTNVEVHEAVTDLITFWMRRGIDGFRVDTAQLFAKHPDLPDQPRVDVANDGSGRVMEHKGFEHIYDTDQPAVLDAMRVLGTPTHEHGGMLVGEVFIPEPAKLVRYVEGQDGLNLTFFFGFVEHGWDPERMLGQLRDALVLGPNVSWVLASHDSARPVSRYASEGPDGLEIGRERTLAFHTLLFSMPGVPFLYQGEELALANGIVPPERAKDPIALAGETSAARDVARTPIPWSDGPMWGFTSADDAWLPEGGRTAADTADWQRGRAGSWFERYRALIATRKAHGELVHAPIEWVGREPSMVIVRRGDVVCVANLTDDSTAAELPAGDVLFSTDGRSTAIGTLRARSAAIIRQR